MNPKLEASDLISALQTLKGFDLVDLLDAFSNEPQDLLDLLIGFKSRHELIFQEISSALEQKNVAHAKELVHKLKGTAANVGAVVLAESATVLESELRLDKYEVETLKKLETSFLITMTSLGELQKKVN